LFHRTRLPDKSEIVVNADRDVVVGKLRN
jgi:hypothetical protein